MKQLLSSAMLRASVLCAGLSLIAIFPQQAAAQDPPAVPGPGVTYIIKNLDSTGAFASRGVITLNADHTLSVIDSGQGGPTYFFSSQLGTWGFTQAGLVGRTIDFDYPSSAGGADVARLDYTFKFASKGSISGTITVYYFPLTADPLGSGGTSGGTFTFTGYLVTLP